jgi:hypothetical protein
LHIGSAARAADPFLFLAQVLINFQKKVLFSAVLYFAVEMRFCAQYHINPAWYAHIREEGGLCPTMIERTLAPEREQ